MHQYVDRGINFPGWRKGYFRKPTPYILFCVLCHFCFCCPIVESLSPSFFIIYDEFNLIRIRFELRRIHGVGLSAPNQSTPPALRDRRTRLAWGGEARQSEDVSFSGLSWQGMFSLLCRIPRILRFFFASYLKPVF